MGKIITLILVAAGTLVIARAKAQDIVKSGTLRAHLTLSPGFSLSSVPSQFYLHGSAGVYLDRRYSIAGEGFTLLGNLSSDDESTFAFNHNLFFGAFRHFMWNNHDFYTGIQPGIGIAALGGRYPVSDSGQTAISPLVSPVLGYNFYVHRIFHFFVQTRVVVGKHLADVPVNQAEWRLSGGLGFNF